MPIDESAEAKREREICPVCRSPQRRTVERMRRLERAPYTDIHRLLQANDEGISLRWVIRHFSRGHDAFSPTEETQLPAWVFEDEAELERYMHEYGYCRTIDDLCPHVPPRTIRTCEEIAHPECERWRAHTFLERLTDLEMRYNPAAASESGVGGRVELVEPLAPQQKIEVESPSGPRRGIYASAVLALDPSRFIVSVPTRLHEMLPLRPGDRIAVSYRGRISKYVFETTVRAVTENRVELDPPGTIIIASRRSPRVSLQGSDVRLVRVERGHDVVTGTGLDASVQGVRVVVSTELVQWERVQITLSLPDGALTADGEVVRVEHLGPNEVAYGIYFTGLNSEEMARLRRLGG